MRSKLIKLYVIVFSFKEKEEGIKDESIKSFRITFIDTGQDYNCKRSQYSLKQ